MSRASRIGAEFAYRNGPFLVQAEYIRAEIERFPGPGGPQPVLGFQGGYVEASVVLNGDGRSYALTPQGGTTYATFKGVQPREDQRVSRGGTGVFELAALYSAIGLDTGRFRGGGGAGHDPWRQVVPRAQHSLIANDIHGRVRPGAAQSDAFGTAPFSVNTCVARVQVYW